MKKLLLLITALFFMSSFAYAENKLELSGDFSITGKNIKEKETKKEEDSNSFYEQELNIEAKINAGEKTTITTNFVIAKVEWDEGEKDGDNSKLGAEGYPGTKEENFNVERAFLTHNFDATFSLDVGIMSGGNWGTSFGNNEEARNRIKFSKTIPSGTFIGIVEKRNDDSVGNNNNKDEEDVYYLGYEKQIGNTNIKPLFMRLNKEGEKSLELNRIDFALDGSAGGFGYEAELIYDNYEENDIKTKAFQVYANLWKDIENLKIGLVLAYGNEDGEKSVIGGFGEDFNDSSELLDEFVDDKLASMTFTQLYSEYIFNNNFSTKFLISYFSSNIDKFKAGTLNNSKGYGIDMFGIYKLSDNTSYTLCVSGGKIKDFEAENSDKTLTKIMNKIEVTF